MSPSLLQLRARGVPLSVSGRTRLCAFATLSAKRHASTDFQRERLRKCGYRASLRIFAHAGHEHSHDESPCCDRTVGHTHGAQYHASNPLHRILKALLDVTQITPLAAWLETNSAIAIAKVISLLVAAGAAWIAGQTVEATSAVFLRRIADAATASVFIMAGIPAGVDILYDLMALHIDTHVLMNLAVIGTLVTGFPLEGALLLVLFQTSHSVEHALTARAQGNLQALYDAVPDHADVVDLGPDGKTPAVKSARRVLASEVGVGQLVLVKPGGQVPLDGCIAHGRALVSAEHITGESLPALRREGDAVPAGALCHDGVLVVEVMRIAADSTPARIARLARDAQAQRPQLRTWLDRFGEMYSKAVVGMAATAFVVMVASGVPMFATAGVERGALYRAMGLLTVASPCALVMVPLAYVSAIAAVASRGVLLKGGRVLDAVDRCRVVGVDKTGTLTTGRLALKDITAIGNTGAPDLSLALRVAAAVSLHSNHPVSDAVVEHSDKEGLDVEGVGVSEFSLVAGGGVTAVVTIPIEQNTIGENNGAHAKGTYTARFGSLDFVASQLDISEVHTAQQIISKRGSSSTASVLLLVPVGDGDPQTASRSWIFNFEDTLRSHSAAAVDTLQRGAWAGEPSASRECDVIMLTGDNEASARRVAAALGIAKVCWGLSPEDKLQELKALQTQVGNEPLDKKGKSRRRQGVVMIGDGLNDAAALAAADVGIAIASSSTAAATLASDAVVVNDAAGISTVPLLLQVARATRYVILQNLALAAGSILVLAAPTVLGFLPLWLAVVLHEGSTLLVALNSLRLLRFSSWNEGVEGAVAGARPLAAVSGGIINEKRRPFYDAVQPMIT